uniref:Uncharacterized protein n=1 Tax=Rhodnius prolixus TaxID=13249 RepID=T1IER2_RHOPR
MSLELTIFLLILGLSSSIASPTNEKSCKKVCITVNTCATDGTICDDLTGPKYSKCQIKCNRVDIMETIEKIELNNLFSYDEKPKLEQRNGVIDEEELREEFQELLRAKLQNKKRDFDAERVGDENLHRVKNLDILGVLDKSLVLLNSPWGISRRIKRTPLPQFGGGIGAGAAGGAAGKIGGSIGAGIGLGPGGLTAGISGGASGEASGYAQGMAGAGVGTPGYGYPVAGYPGMIGRNNLLTFIIGNNFELKQKMSLELSTFLLILGLSSSVASPIYEKSCKKVCITVNSCATDGTLCDDLTGPKYSKCQIKCNRDDIMETIEKIELNNLFSYDEKPKLEQRNGVIDEEELREEVKEFLRAKLQNRKRDFDAERVGDENLHRVKNLDILGVLDKSLVLLNSPWGISRRVKRTALPQLGGGIGAGAAGGAAGRLGGSIGAGIGLGPGGLTAGISGGATGEASGYAQGMAGAGAGTPGYGYPVAGYPGMIGREILTTPKTGELKETFGLSSSVASPTNEKSCKKVCITVNTCATDGTLCDDLTGPKYSKCQIKCNRVDIMETIEKIELNNLFSYDEKPKLEQRNGVIDDDEIREEFKELLRAKLQNRKSDFDAVRVGDENLHRVNNLDILGVLDKSLVLLNSPLQNSRRVKRTLPLLGGLGAGAGAGAAGGVAGKIGGSIGGGIGIGPGGLMAGLSGSATGEASGYAQGLTGAGLGTPGYGYPVAGFPGYPGMFGAYAPQFTQTKALKEE